MPAGGERQRRARSMGAHFRRVLSPAAAVQWLRAAMLRRVVPWVLAAVLQPVAVRWQPDRCACAASQQERTASHSGVWRPWLWVQRARWGCLRRRRRTARKAVGVRRGSSRGVAVAPTRRPQQRMLVEPLEAWSQGCDHPRLHCVHGRGGDGAATAVVEQSAEPWHLQQAQRMTELGQQRMTSGRRRGGRAPVDRTRARLSRWASAVVSVAVPGKRQ